MTIQAHGGVKASTTGNITGIYDMSGGSWERVSGYVNNGHNNLTRYGEALVEIETIKHKNIYNAYDANGNIITTGTDSQEKNYMNLKEIFGNSMYETSSDYNNTNNSWKNDTSICFANDYPFLVRGGHYDYNLSSGIFCFERANGGESYRNSFRPTIVVY